MTDFGSIGTTRGNKKALGQDDPGLWNTEPTMGLEPMTCCLRNSCSTN